MEVVAEVALAVELEEVELRNLVLDLRWYNNMEEHLPPGTAVVWMALV